jgi:hypothetical protein
MLAGAAPIPASSGQTIRHRLNRAGDRQLNCALHTIVLTRLKHGAMNVQPEHPSPAELGQQRRMGIQNPALELRERPGPKLLHVARQDEELDLMIYQDSPDRGIQLVRVRMGAPRQMSSRDSSRSRSDERS